VISRLKHLTNSALTHQGFMRYFANTSWMFGEQILRMASGLLVGIWVARYLGPEQFGLFSYALAFVSIFSGLAKLGLDGIVVRDLVNHPHQRDVYLGTAFWLKFVGAFVMLGVVALATLFTSNDHTTNLYVFIIASGIIFQSFEVVDFYFQSKVLSKFVSICKITQLAVSSALKVYFVLTGADLIWFVVVTLADQFLLALTLFIAYRYQKLGSFYQYFDITLAKKLLKNSWPLILSGLAVALYMRIDQIMIKEMLGDKEAGIYSAAVRLSEVWYFIPVIITSSLFPAIVSAKKISEELYYTRLQRLYTLMVWIAIGIALPMTFLCGWLVALLYGEAYAGAAQVLMIHIWAGIFVFLGVASGSWFNNENLQQYSFYRTVLGALINIGLNLALIPRFGVVGAAIATVIAQSIAALFFDLYTTKTRIAFFMKIKTVYFAGLIKGK
jgi:O-antigen/teichoic acid export membrane protein